MNRTLKIPIRTVAPPPAVALVLRLTLTLALFWALAAAMPGWNTAHAQTQAEADRLRPTPPERMHFKITATTTAGPAEAAPSGPPRLLEIEVQKTPAVARMTQRWSNGKVSESWIADGYLLTTYPALPDIYVTSLSLRAVGSDDGISDFHSMYPGFGWVEPRFFTAVVTLNGRKCNHFANKEADREAWVDAETRLPVAYTKGKTKFSYEFLPAPQQDPTMPAAFRTELQIYKKADAR
ncbi:MAG: hypothetical protein ACAI35_10395 [Candidatus Methylacidiphilales bacterium]|nr:hypothetical protein [Candidatus Methylacidiphilales bacterium]